MKKHLCRALLALTLALAVTETTLPTAWAAESEENAPLDCASALLMEAESGRVLFEYNADDRHAPASITKIMTMLLVCEAVDAGLYGFTPSGLSPQESPLRAAFIPGPDFPQGKTVLTVRAGYPAERFPEPIRQWMLVRIGTLYEQRESFAVGSNFNEFGRSFVDCLLDPYVVAGGF